ncbi:hypothetical protein LtaPh_0305100 [Leishmania tarentolae]|uniref:Uncharacterized protein n=1 Tax=Leishmania tarentolae TaxID=5689 RepID=A0A640KDH1_LEITA|nr:hypothetical protein LtaPh_0305100 [Leishmania tarentolae]
MSSDFETLSCSPECSEPGERRGISSGASSDFGALDDLVDRNDVQRLRRIAARHVDAVVDAHQAPSCEHANTHSGRHASVLHGYRTDSATGEVQATSPAARGGDCDKRHPFTERPANCCRLPATVAHNRVKSRESVDNPEDAFAATVVTPRSTGGMPPWAATAAAVTSSAAHAWAFVGREQSSPIERRVTCPPDSGSLTSVTSTAIRTDSATTRRTPDSTNDDDSAEDDGRAEEERADVKCSHTVQHQGLERDVSIDAVASHIPKPTSRTPRHRSAQDFDGFYNTGLLLDDDDDDDDDAAESEQGHGPACALDSAATSSPSAALPASLRRIRGPCEPCGNCAPIGFPRACVITAASHPHTDWHGERPAPPTATNATSVSAPRSLTTASRRKAAGDQLCRLAVVLPTMTTVHWLSLVITVLVPVNLLCLDVMALGWIRRRVDASYGGACALQLSSWSKAHTSLRVVICGASGVSTGVAESPLSCANDSQYTLNLGATTVTPTSGGSTACSSNSERVDAESTSFSSAHTVPALCSVILWLLAPNGLLCRLVIHQFRRPTKEAVTDEQATEDVSVVDLSRSVSATAATRTDDYHQLRAEWQVCCDVYAHVRQLAPKLEVLELVIRYACLWVMLHAPLSCAATASEWTHTWLLQAPVPEDETVVAQNDSVTASVAPRLATDAIVAA